MRIRKAFQGTIPENKILDTYSSSQTDTYSCNYVNQMNIYSTDEVRIGTWFGKPLYRKCQTGTKNDTSSIRLNLTAQNVETYVMVKVLTPRSHTDTRAGTTNEYFNRENDMIGNYLDSPNSDQITIRQGSGWPTIPYDYVIVMEYTKTTD